MNKAIPQFMGVSIPRREDPALITGEGQYVADIQLDNMAYMAVVRSPFAHAKITSIDTAQAAEMDGVLAVLTGDDVNGQLAENLKLSGKFGEPYYETKFPERQALATDVVRLVGEPVAVVVAETAYVAADAAEFVMVDYEPLPVVSDPEAALADDAPLVHEELPDNVVFRWKSEAGDIESAFAEAETVVELRLVNQRLLPSAIEPRAATASYDAQSDETTVWTTTQAPHNARNKLAKALGLERNQMRAIAPEVGGGFGAKANVYYEELLATLLARQLGRPVNWVATRSEDYLSTVHGRDQINYVRLAADKDGKVRGIDLKVIADLGAYHSDTAIYVAPTTGEMMTGTYDIANARADVVAVFTNKEPMEPYRGAGRPEAIYLLERAMDYLADKLEIDPVELRRRNFIAPYGLPLHDANRFRIR